MPRTPSQIDDEYQISITSRRGGWCELHVFKHGEIFAFDVFSPAFQHVMSLCSAIIDNIAIIEPFHSEPDGCLWRLTPNKSQQHTMQLEIFDFIGYYSFSEADCHDPVVTLTVKRKQLLTILMVELWKNALLYEEPSYQKSRRQFPWKEFRNLIQKWDQSRLGPSPIPLV